MKDLAGRRVLMCRSGQEEQSLQPGLNGCYRLNEETFARLVGNDEDAPRADLAARTRNGRYKARGRHASNPQEAENATV
jgi:hypothetical protein